MHNTSFVTARARLARLAATALAFGALYTACNQFTQARGESSFGNGVFDWERATPFLPWTIVPYLSIFGFFVLSFLLERERRPLDRHVAALTVDLLLSALCWLLMPLHFAFERPPINGWAAPMFALLAATDLPYNRAPSMHISVLVILAVRLTPLVAGWRRAALQGWFMLIGLSVLTTWQHHVIDIPAGLAAAGLSLWVARRLTTNGPSWPNPSPGVSVPAAWIRQAAGCLPTDSR
jgi:hypothetical protein